MKHFYTLVVLTHFVTGCLVEGEEHSTPTTPPAPTIKYYLEDPVPVISVTDGDTIKVRINNNEETIRLKGIDTPERVKKCSDASDCDAQHECIYESYYDAKVCIHNGVVQPEQCYEAAKNFNYQRIGPQVDLKFDSRCGNEPIKNCRDQYKRLLAYVTLSDNSDLGSLLIKHGLAEIFIYAGENFDNKDEYLKLEQDAQNNEKGIWGTGCP